MAKTWLIFVFMTVSSWGLYGVFSTSGTDLYGRSRTRALQGVPLCRACLPTRSGHRLCPDAYPERV